MRNPEKVLYSLMEHSKDSRYSFERLYRLLFNEALVHRATGQLDAQGGSRPLGAGAQRTEPTSLDRLGKLIASLKDESYQPQLSKSEYRVKNSGNRQAIGLQAIDDRLVQAVIRLILEAIYEGSFESNAHGFRPNRTCHTALAQVQRSFPQASWFIAGDLNQDLARIPGDVVIGLLEERIADHRFIRLIRKFLNAGYFDDWSFHNTYSGTPQGGIISPILANITLDSLDKFMNGCTATLEKQGNVGPWNAAKDPDGVPLPASLKKGSKYTRLNYVRHAGSFLIGIKGSKKEAMQVKQAIQCFLALQLKLKGAGDKIRLSHTQEPVHFLGYKVFVKKYQAHLGAKADRLTRSCGKRVCLNVSMEAIRTQLRAYGALEFRCEKGKQRWKPTCRSGLIFTNDLEILDRYNREIRGFYQYYALATNRSELHKFKHIMEYSMYKTLAGKYKSSTRKVNAKYRRNGKFTVKLPTNSGAVKQRDFYDSRAKTKPPMTDQGMDCMPHSSRDAATRNLKRGLKAKKCAMSGPSRSAREGPLPQGGKKPLHERPKRSTANPSRT